MILRIVEATVCGATSLELVFNNGTRKRVNVLPLLTGSIFEPLHDAAYFARGVLDPILGTVVWPNEADFAPEALYALSDEKAPTEQPIVLAQAQKTKDEDFFERLNFELEDLQENIGVLPLAASTNRIGDFGCGTGYATFSLMLALHATECIGIDIAPQEAQRLSDGIKNTFLHQLDNPPKLGLEREIQQLLRKNRWPIFQQGDLVKSSNLPKDLDFVYCKLVLGNIYEGTYGNLINNIDGVNKAIDSLTSSIRVGGLVCIVEKTMDVGNFLPTQHLVLLRRCQLLNKPSDSRFVYLCKRTT